MSAQDLERRFIVEGWTARDHLVEDDSQAVNVGARVQLTLIDLFWRNIFGSAQEGIGRRQGILVIGRNHASQAEVCEIRISQIVKQNVTWFNVTMEKALCVGIVQCRGNLVEN